VVIRAAGAAVLALALSAHRAPGQDPGLSAERKAYLQWLTTAPTSPLAAVAMRRLDVPVTIGPASADIPLPGFAPSTVAESRGAVTLTGADGRARVLPRNRATTIAPWTFQVTGGSGTSVLAVFGPLRHASTAYYAPNASWSFVLALQPAAAPERRRVLTLDGIEVEGELAGYLLLPGASPSERLQVLRLPVPGTEETELQVYVRDATSGRGTYPAGRFVEVVPVEGGRYRIDFNRARNPFCAYSSVYACPVPWPGNSIKAEVTAGERYLPAAPHD
jgi:uncharacterized protein (DUF1684 family)